MKLGIMQPYFLPYIGYFQLINSVDKFILYDDVNFINRGWINRNYILVNNRKTLFTIPLKNKSQNKLIKEIKISEEQKWKKKIIKTLHMAYKKAPYYKKAIKVLEEIFYFQEIDLTNFLKHSLDVILSYLDIHTFIIKSSETYSNSFLKAQDRIIDICKKESAEIYINPIGGQEFYQKEKFKKNGIQLYFLKSNEIKYEQFNDNFIPNLSIIDLMMFNNITTIKTFLNKFTLI